ncbi:hypothetical protein Tco_0393156 [Tanacetum coccineum]
MRSKTIEQTTSLFANNADLKAQIQEKDFAIAALKNDLRKLKGNSVDTKFAKTSVLEKSVLQSPRKQSVVRQPNAFKSERPQMLKPRFASLVDVSNNLSRPVTQHYLPKRRESVFAKPDHMIESSEFRSTADGSKPKPKSNNQTPRSLPIPTGKLFNSCTSKDDSESTHGSNIDILNIHESKQTLDLSARTSSNVPKEQSLDLSAVYSVLCSTNMSMEKIKLFQKSFVVTVADASVKRQQQPDFTSSTSTLATTVTADGNFDL